MPVTIPAELSHALKGDAGARARFAALPPSHRAEYIRYITDAVKPETRARRAAKTLGMLKARPAVAKASPKTRAAR